MRALVNLHKTGRTRHSTDTLHTLYIQHNVGLGRGLFPFRLVLCCGSLCLELGCRCGIALLVIGEEVLIVAVVSALARRARQNTRKRATSIAAQLLG